MSGNKLLKQTPYSYDALNRLTSVNDSGYSRAFQYDSVGNMSVQGYSGIGLSSLTPYSGSGGNPFDGKNHLLSGEYDLVGNQTRVGSLRIGYDAENRQGSLTDSLDSTVSVQYQYDGDGNRVLKSSSSGRTVYVYDALGQMLAEYSNAAAVPSPCKTCYLAYDHLGSVRLVMDETGNVVARHDYLPFGEEVASNTAGRNAQFGVANGVKQRFTGQESAGGSVPNLDYFYARYFNGEQGRFLSADPENAGADPMNPQSWNAYSYAANNPMVMTDPSGMTACDANGNNCKDGTTVTAPAQGLSPLDQLLYRSISSPVLYSMQMQQQMQTGVQAVANWMGRPRNGSCLSASTAAGGMVGSAVGMLGVAGGPAVGITEPTGMAIGGGAGWLGGMVSCMSSTGTGGAGATASKGAQDK